MTLKKGKSISVNKTWNAVLPPEVLDCFNQKDPPVFFIGSGFGKEAIPPLSTGGELASELRRLLRLDKSNEDGLSELLQYYKNSQTKSKKTVVDWLKKELRHGKSKPGDAHRLLLELPGKIFFTTNYDSLIQEAANDISYRVITVDQPNDLNSNYADVQGKQRVGLLVRLHGAFEAQDKIVATTDD